MKKNSLKGFLSPFRYPGGKSWFAKIASKWLVYQNQHSKLLIEPFAGGASVSMAAIYNELVKAVIISEIDSDVAAVWETILNGQAKWLSTRIANFRLNRKGVKDVISSNPKDRRARAFRCILQNRTARGGVIAKGAGLIRNGEDGKGLKSRWYPDTLVERIKAIAALKSKIKFEKNDAILLIQRHLSKKDVMFFIDPPYTKAARRLYKHWKINHEELFSVLSRARGDVLMTYDDTHEIRKLAKKYGFAFRRISMRTSHHENKRELMLSKNFCWLK